MPRALIVGAARTPIGSFNGALKTVPATSLGSTAIKKALASARVAPTEVDEVLMGQVLQAGAGQNPARQASIGADIPSSVDATTINKVCASGLKSVVYGAQSLALGENDIVVCGGMESMSLAPYYMPRASAAFGHRQASDSLLIDGLWDSTYDCHMGTCGESAATKHAISRAEQDEYAVRSYTRSRQAWADKLFASEIAPVEIQSKSGTTVIEADEECKNFRPDKMPSLRPSFDKQGTITAANASTLSDGASAVVLASPQAVETRSLTPLAEIISYADAAMDPIDFPIAPTLAIPRALSRASLSVADIARWEINEAFSCVPLLTAKVLKIDMNRVNVRGGAVSLGHPIGASGNRILVSLLHTLQPGEYGCAAICNGGGSATAMVIRRM